MSQKDIFKKKCKNLSHLTHNDFSQDKKGKIVLTKHQKNKTGAFIMFYVSWCGYCERFKDDYVAFAEEMESKKIPVYVYDCESSDDATSFARQTVGVPSYPSLYYVCGNHKHLHKLDSREPAYLRYVAHNSC